MITKTGCDRGTYPAKLLSTKQTIHSHMNKDLPKNTNNQWIGIGRSLYSEGFQNITYLE